MGMTMPVHCDQSIIILCDHLAMGAHAEGAHAILKRAGIEDEFTLKNNLSQGIHHFRRELDSDPNIHWIYCGSQPQSSALCYQPLGPLPARPDNYEFPCVFQ